MEYYSVPSVGASCTTGRIVERRVPFSLIIEPGCKLPVSFWFLHIPIKWRISMAWPTTAPTSMDLGYRPRAAVYPEIPGRARFEA